MNILDLAAIPATLADHRAAAEARRTRLSAARVEIARRAAAIRAARAARLAGGAASCVVFG